MAKYPRPNDHRPSKVVAAQSNASIQDVETLAYAQAQSSMASHHSSLC
jgi:hypothetical protein